MFDELQVSCFARDARADRPVFHEEVSNRTPKASTCCSTHLYDLVKYGRKGQWIFAMSRQGSIHFGLPTCFIEVADAAGYGRHVPPRTEPYRGRASGTNGVQTALACQMQYRSDR
ncbi:hypothetical protein [Pararhizobium mangrovi]|uniref:hypothetical protein n=1 Tax=Pararhizobium mangrovi TaxID=2590452 RepID=UPI0015E85AA9|nr:hypothetical protein [Pararhizobium mangrovi]